VTTTLGYTREDRRWLFVLFGLGAALLLGVTPWVAQWLAEFPFVPFGAVLGWVGGLDDPWMHVARPVVGLLLGLVLAVVVVEDEYRLEIGPESVVVIHGSDRRTIARREIVGIHRDRGKVHIDGREGRVLFAKKVEAGKDDVRRAFLAQGYPYESD
jgi:hypothetical protein